MSSICEGGYRLDGGKLIFDNLVSDRWHLIEKDDGCPFAEFQ